MDDERPEARPEEDHAPRPIGAILVTVFLTTMILISWFGMYFLNFVRS